MLGVYYAYFIAPVENFDLNFLICCACLVLQAADKLLTDHLAQRESTQVLSALSLSHVAMIFQGKPS